MLLDVLWFVCVLVTSMSPTNTVEPIEMPYGDWGADVCGPKEPYIGWGFTLAPAGLMCAVRTIATMDGWMNLRSDCGSSGWYAMIHSTALRQDRWRSAHLQVYACVKPVGAVQLL